jgi:type I restriction enzyme R subunit
MTLNESIVEDAALEWFGELGYAVGHGPHLAPGEPAAERDSFGKGVLVGRLREAIRRLNPAIPEEARAVIKRYLKARFVRRINP